LGQVRPALRGGGRGPDQRPHRVVGAQAIGYLIQVAEHDHQQVVEVMGDASRELAYGFHFLRLMKLLFHPLQLRHPFSLTLRRLARAAGLDQRDVPLAAPNHEKDRGPDQGDEPGPGRDVAGDRSVPVGQHIAAGEGDIDH
jgi:hypothetical protein